MDYEEQVVFKNFHILPDNFENQDFFRMQEVLKAKSPEERVQDPHEMLKNMGLM